MLPRGALRQRNTEKPGRQQPSGSGKAPPDELIRPQKPPNPVREEAAEGKRPRWLPGNQRLHEAAAPCRLIPALTTATTGKTAVRHRSGCPHAAALAGTRPFSHPPLSRTDPWILVFTGSPELRWSGTPIHPGGSTVATGTRHPEARHPGNLRQFPLARCHGYPPPHEGLVTPLL